jgi:hypothetical protein
LGAQSIARGHIGDNIMLNDIDDINDKINQINHVPKKCFSPKFHRRFLSAATNFCQWGYGEKFGEKSSASPRFAPRDGLPAHAAQSITHVQSIARFYFDFESG